MESLRELPETRQIDGEPKRRWFSSPDLDLILWFGEAGEPLGFQLCYDKTRGERALTWHEDRGYEHAAVDDGEETLYHKSTPILVADGVFDRERVVDMFLRSSDGVPPTLREYVAERLKDYPET